LRDTIFNVLTENGTPDGTGWATDVFARRTRIQVNGDISKNFSYAFQVDNANFGKFGNYTSRLIVQDAWVSWAPTGNTGGDVLFLYGGLIFVPFSLEVITAIAAKFSAEGHPDLYRGFTPAFFTASRSTGVQIRGWALNKKIGFRGGIYEGQRPFSNTRVNPLSNPLFAGLINIDILGSQEGAFLYQGIYFSKEPLLSISLSGAYQSRALLVPKGVTDQKMLTSMVFLEYPFSENLEVLAQAAGYRYGNGSGSKDTGLGWGADLGVRYKWLKPYVSIEQFTSDDCPGDLIGAAATTCQGPTGAHSADMRNFRAGLDFYINKSQNHVVLEFSVNHGQSSWGPQSITTANAGYVPLGLNPTLAGPAQRSVLLHWNVYF
jgi:hypothetical protein